MTKKGEKPPPWKKVCPYCADSGIVEGSDGGRYRCPCPKGRDPD